MSYFPDLHTASLLGRGERHRAIGWLHPDYKFTRGIVSNECVVALKTHLGEAFEPIAFAGGHECEFCGDCLLSGNLLIPTQKVVYVAPEMILHYITEHDYAPPDEFCSAVVECPKQGSPEYMALLSPFLTCFSITPPDSLPTPDERAQLAHLLSQAFKDIERLCRAGDIEGAIVLASACKELSESIHGWGLWYRHIFPQLVRNGRSKCPLLDEYLIEYNEVFHGEIDPDLSDT